jgi:hypothetical protein
LQQIAKARTSSVSLAQRSQIILLEFDGNNEAIEQAVGLQHDAIGVSRRRWRDHWPRLFEIECAEKPHVLKQEIIRLPSDLPRAGRKRVVTENSKRRSSRKPAKILPTAIAPSPSGRIASLRCT